VYFSFFDEETTTKTTMGGKQRAAKEDARARKKQVRDPTGSALLHRLLST